jgi:hypothetical protein
MVLPDPGHGLVTASISIDVPNVAQGAPTES